MTSEIDRARLAELLRAEDERFIAEHPRSRELFEQGRQSLLAGVPMPWMTEWAGSTMRSQGVKPTRYSRR